MVWFQFVDVPILLDPRSSSKIVDPDTIPRILRNHPSVRRALAVKIVLNRLRDGTYYVSPARTSNTPLRKEPTTSNPPPSFARDETGTRTPVPTKNRFEKQIIILNVLPGNQFGIEQTNSLTFKWRTIGQCENCLLCRSNHHTLLNSKTYYLSPSMRALIPRIVELEQNTQVLMYPLIVNGNAPQKAE